MARPSWPYLPQSLLLLQHIFLLHPRGKCLSTDCPVVIIDSVTCVKYASPLGMSFHQLSSRLWWCGDVCVSHVSTLGVSVHQFSSRQWWFTDMCQSCINRGWICKGDCDSSTACMLTLCVNEKQKETFASLLTRKLSVKEIMARLKLLTVVRSFQIIWYYLLQKRAILSNWWYVFGLCQPWRLPKQLSWFCK